MEKHLQIFTRKQAKKLGCSFYFPASMCKNGHISERYSSSGTCLECYLEKTSTPEHMQKERERASLRRMTPQYKKRMKEYCRKYNQREENKKRQRERKKTAKGKEEQRKWRASPSGKIYKFMRRSIYRSIMNDAKDDLTESLLGYRRKDLIDHIERQFSKGMTWDNYGKWHIDHIIPISHYLKEGESDPSVINALTNLKPVWAKENLKKSANVQNLL